MNMRIFLFGLAISLILLSCKSKIQKNYSDIKGKIEVIHTGKKSGYNWRFLRNFRNYLQFIEDKKYTKGKLLTIKFNEDKTLVGLNFIESKLIFFDGALNAIGSFANSKNLAKGFSRIMDYDLDQTNLRLYDFSDKSIKNIKLSTDSLIYQFHLPDSKGIYRVGFVAEDKYIYIHPQDSLKDMQFIVYDYLSKKALSINSLNKLLGLGDSNKVSYPSIVYNGYFVRDKNSSFFVYYCTFTGLYFCFQNKSGNFIYADTTVDATPKPQVEFELISPLQQALEIKPNEMYFPSAAISNNKLYLLNNITTDNDFVVDVYSLEKKRGYSESLFIPMTDSKPQSIAVNNNKIYVLYEDGTISKYNIVSF